MENAEPNEENLEQGEKFPFAFSKCANVQKKALSTYSAECLICGKKVWSSEHLAYANLMNQTAQTD